MITKKKLLVIIIGLALMAGCATTPKEKPFEVKVWGGLQVSIAAYDAAMKSLKELYATGAISTAAAQKAWDAGEAFYLAQKAGITALRTYTEVKTAGNQQALNLAIAQAGARLAGFTALVTPFIAKHLVDDLNDAQTKLKEVK